MRLIEEVRKDRKIIIKQRTYFFITDLFISVGRVLLVGTLPGPLPDSANHRRELRYGGVDHSFVVPFLLDSVSNLGDACA